MKKLSFESAGGLRGMKWIRGAAVVWGIVKAIPEANWNRSEHRSTVSLNKIMIKKKNVKFRRELRDRYQVMKPGTNS